LWLNVTIPCIYCFLTQRNKFGSELWFFCFSIEEKSIVNCPISMRIIMTVCTFPHNLSLKIILVKNFVENNFSIVNYVVIQMHIHTSFIGK